MTFRPALKLTRVLLPMLMLPLTHSDEGMWLFNDPPRKILQERYGFTPSEDWLEHVQKSSIRFNSGGSGSFISEEGLVMSNHHVGADALQKLSTAEKNLLRDGFHARTREEELKCHDLELNVLMNIQDVTERVNGAVKEGASPEEAFAARRAVMAEIEKELLDKTGLRSDVVTLFQGGKYHLYQFKKYTDVRLVWAPEQQIAFFGGDPDNFEYPRYCLDVCFFRAYEDGRPAKTPHHLKWSKSGPSEGELVFVSGHPGGTSRLLTMDELEYKRDHQFPFSMEVLHRLEVVLSVYSSESAENARRAKDLLFGVQNSRKARGGGLQGLLDPELMGRKRAEEQQLKKLIQSKPELRDALEAWDRIAEAQEIIRKHALEYNMLERGFAFNSQLFDITRTIVRAAQERPKPSGERLREFRDSARESLELALFSEEPIYEDFEQVKLADSLTFFAAKFGFDHPLVQKALAGKSPRERAAELISAADVKEVPRRKELYEKDAGFFQDSSNPMVQLVLLVDEEARAVRKLLETQDEIKRQAYAEIADARFKVMGTGTYPDATFTLRLAFGKAVGYEEDGQMVPFQTRLAGLYERAAEHNFTSPFDLPASWLARGDGAPKPRPGLNLDTPYNFVSTADIIGGNSGSPVINKDAEVVGLIFDGNIYSLVLDFIYSDTKARAISVHSSAILEGLRNVYQAQNLVNEILGSSSARGRRSGG